MMSLFVAFHDDTGCNHAAMIIAGYLQKNHPVPSKAIIAMVNEIQPDSVVQAQQQETSFSYNWRHLAAKLDQSEFSSLIAPPFVTGSSKVITVDL